MKVRNLALHLAYHLNLDAALFVELHRALREGFTASVEDLPDYLDRDSLELLGELGQKLTGKPGRGGGIEADPIIVALLTIASLIEAERSKVAIKTIECWAAMPVDLEPSDGVFLARDRCPFTEQTCFGEAFAAIISDHKLALAVMHIDVSHESGEMLIQGPRKILARFMRKADGLHQHPNIFIGRINYYGLIRLNRYLAGDPDFSFDAENKKREPAALDRGC